jgi:hypothetical protein
MVVHIFCTYCAEDGVCTFLKNRGPFVLSVPQQNVFDLHSVGRVPLAMTVGGNLQILSKAQGMAFPVVALG